MKFYSPLAADFFPNEPDYEDEFYDEYEGCPLDGHDLLQYADAVDEAVKKDIADFNGDLMQYYHEDDSVRSKVVSAVPSVEICGNKLCGCLTVELKETLLDDEQTVLCNYISGQYSDGWGEGFEQRDIRVDDGTLAVHFWQEDGFKMTPSFEKIPKPEKNSLRPKMQLIGQDGNIFAIMGRASRLLKSSGQGDKAKEMRDRVMSCDSYQKALSIVSEYVETELSPSPTPKRDRGDENHPKEGGWWYTSAVRFMLHNEAYKGDTLHQKHYTTDTLPFMVYHNEGQFPKYCAYKSHVAIVSDEDFDKVQQLLKTKQMSVPNAAPRVFTKKIYCAECGTVFAQASRANGAVAWGCRKHLNKSSLCPVKSVYETELCRAFLYMYNKLQANRARIFRPMVDSLLQLKSQQEHQNTARESIYAEIQRLAKQNHNLERIHAQGYIEDTQYIERKTLIEQQLDEKRVQLSRTSISRNVEQTLKGTKQIEKIMASGPPLTYFDEHTFTEMVKKVSVSNTAIEFELINGMKLSEERTEK